MRRTLTARNGCQVPRAVERAVTSTRLLARHRQCCGRVGSGFTGNFCARGRSTRRRSLPRRNFVRLEELELARSETARAKTGAKPAACRTSHARLLQRASRSMSPSRAAHFAQRGLTRRACVPRRQWHTHRHGEAPAACRRTQVTHAPFSLGHSAEGGPRGPRGLTCRSAAAAVA